MGSALRDAELRVCLPADLDPSRPIPVDLTLPPLTLMQSVVACGIADGLSNAAIAHRLGISPLTVKKHVSTIIVELDVGAGYYHRVAIAHWVWERIDGLRTDMPGPARAPDDPGDPDCLDGRQDRRAEQTEGRPTGHDGRDWRPRQTLPLTMTAPGRPEAVKLLTPAEWAVLEGVMDGLDDGEIAARLGVAVNTVKNHSWGIHQKVGVRGRSARIALVLWAYAHVSALHGSFASPGAR